MKDEDVSVHTAPPVVVSTSTFAFLIHIIYMPCLSMQAINPLLDYLTSNLQMFGSHLFPAVFEM